MHGQGNYTTQVGQGSFAPPFTFQQRPLPPLLQQSSLHPQPQVIQQGHPSFHLRPGFLSYQHTIPNVPHQGLPAPAVSTVPNSGLSYATPPQPLQGQTNTQMSFSYRTSVQQCAPWNQNVHQFLPAAPPPGPSAYPLVSLQEHALERGPSHQPSPVSRHIPPPLLQPPKAFSSSTLLRSDDPQGASVVPERQQSYQQPMGSLPPQALPPPPPPPLPSSSPPGAPPLPPSSPPSNVLPQNDVSCSLKEEVKNGNNLMLECSRKCEQTENADLKVELGDASVDHLPGDSDMDMEDDITVLDTEKKSSSLDNLNNEVDHVSTSLDDHMKARIHDLQGIGIHKLAEVDLNASAVSSTSKNLRGADESSRQSNGQTKQPLDVPASQLGNFSKLSVPVAFAETGYGKLSDQVNEGTNPFNLLQDYASDGISENEADKLPGDASSPSIIDRKKYCDAEEGCNFGSELRLESTPECSKHMVSKSMIESENMMETYKMTLEAGKVENFSDKGRVGREFVRLQSKDASRNYSTNIEGAKLHQPGRLSNFTDLNVDEFGRLIREGVSDSDASDSPGYRRKSARRARKRSRSPSRGQSPHEWRRRSPRRKERRGRSRSWSPRSWSRSPIMRRDTEFIGDKLRREKGQLSVCFNFTRGKCYRGANCRYSHHESDKSERKKYNRVKQQYWDKPPVLGSPEFHDESNSLPEKEVKHKGLRPSPKEVKESKGVPVNSAFCTRKSDEDSSLLVADAVASNVSGYSAHEISRRSESSLIPESSVAGKIHQINQRSHLIHTSLVSESSVAEASINPSMHIPADKPDVKQYPTSQMYPPETKPFLMIIPSQPLKELPPPSTIRLSHSQCTPPLSSASPVVSVPLTLPLMQDYNLMPSIARFHGTLENCSPNRAPVSSQHSQFTVPSNYPSTSIILPPLPSLPHSQLSSSITSREWGFPSQHRQPSLPPQDNSSAYAFRASQNAECHDRSWTDELPAYSIAREPDQGPTFTDRFESRVNSQLNGLRMRGDHISGHRVQGVNPSQPFAQDQPNSLSVHSASKGMQSFVGNPSSDNNSPCTQPYFQQASNEQKYSVIASPPAQLTEIGKVTSSISNCTTDFLERSHPSSVHELGSQILNHFNPSGSTVNLPLSSKLSVNAFAWENDLNINSRYGSTYALTTGPPADRHKIGSFGSKNGMSLSSELPSKTVTPRPGGAQYDPLFDSIEPDLNSLVGDDHQKQETVGDSDDFLKLSGSERILDIEGIKQQGGAAVSANDSVENEEYGETGDAEVGAVLTGTPSNPNDVTDMNAGEVEIDQVKSSGKKKKSKERSMKLFKISIASFVKEVLKPSWRQGNMSKEAFKTIVKKTVDKVSGAMKSRRIPRSQSRINQYIDSSRGKLTKLVMGYVDKYVKV